MVVCKVFDTSPDLSILAKAMDCSRQNVKKLDLNLEKEGYVELVKPSQDARNWTFRRVF